MHTCLLKLPEKSDAEDRGTADDAGSARTLPLRPFSSAGERKSRGANRAPALTYWLVKFAPNVSRPWSTAAPATAAQVARFARRFASSSARRRESSSTFVSRSRERIAVMAGRLGPGAGTGLRAWRRRSPLAAQLRLPLPREHDLLLPRCRRRCRSRWRRADLDSSPNPRRRFVGASPMLRCRRRLPDVFAVVGAFPDAFVGLCFHPRLAHAFSPCTV